MRSALLALLLALPAGAVELYPPAWTPVAVSEFGGLNLLNDSTAIGNDAQKAQNVLTDNGYLEKRPGNVILGTILAGYPVKYVTDWVSPNGTRYLIAHASDTIYQTDFSGSPVALSTAQPLFSITAIPAFSRIYIADGYRAPWYWDGTSTATVVSAAGTAAPLCTYLAFKDARIFCANIRNEGTSRVRISSSGGAGYWVVPSDVSSVDNAANVFDFTPDDGDSIKCLATTPWGMFVGKQYSSSMIKGTGNLSYELRILDPKVGCKDNRSVQMVYGVLQWLSNDGVYAYDGTGPPRLISRELDPLVASLPYSAYGTKFWLNDIQADWQLGNLTASGPGAPISATIVVGSIIGSSVTLADSTTSLLALGTCEGCGIDSRGYVTVAGVSSTYTIRYEANVLPQNDGWNLVTSGGAPSSVIYGSSLTIYGFLFHYKNASTPVTNLNRMLTCRFTSITDNSATCALNLSASVISGDRADCAGSVSMRNGTVYYGVGNCDEVAGATVLMTEAYTSGIYSTFTIIASTPSGVSFWRDGVFKTSSPITFSSTRIYNNVLFGNIGAIPATSSFDFVYFSSGTANPGTSNMVTVAIATFTSRILDTTVSTPTFGILSVTTTTAPNTNISLSIRTSTSPNNDLWSSYTSLPNNTQPAGGQSRYVNYRATMSAPGMIESPGFTNPTLPSATTGYFHSAVKFIGVAISSYGIFTVSQETPNGSTVTYSVRAVTYTFTDASGINIPWTAQTANQVPTIAVSTPTYFQFRALLDFNQPVNAPTISRIQTNWTEGTGQPVSSGVIDRRYHLCVTVSSASTTPDTCLIRQKNGKWVTWTGPSIGAMGLYNYTLVAADGKTSSKIWTIMKAGVYSDDGTAIDSQWVSADYTNGLIFNDKVLHEFWVDAAPVSLSSVTISYQVNKSSGFTDYQFYLDNGNPINPDLAPSGFALHGQINQWVPLLSGYAVGKYARIKFSDSILNNYWRINSFLLYLENKGRQVPN